MAQVKVYALRSKLSPLKNALSDAIHEALVEAFALPHDKRFRRFIGLERDDFVFPPDRTESYTIVEISVFEGRSPDAPGLLGHTRKARRRAGADVQGGRVRRGEQRWTKPPSRSLYHPRCTPRPSAR
jgi:hypothetical protein